MFKNMRKIGEFMMCTSANRTLKLKYPTAWHNDMWREALPSGNGKIGAAVYGSIKQETIIINHNELWHWGKRDELPDVSHKLEETRAFMNEKQFREASWCLTNALKERGYDTTLESPMPLGDLKITMPCETGFKNYYRQLEMETGVVTVAWQEEDNLYQRELFVSRADDIIVYRISASNSVEINISLDVHRDDKNEVPQRFEVIAQSKKYELDAEAGTICYGITHEDQTDCGIVLKVFADEIAEDGTGISAKSHKDILILAKVFVKGSFKNDILTLKQTLNTLSMNYDTLLERHTAIHKPLFQSVDLQINTLEENNYNEYLLLDAYGNEASNELVEKMWAYGRYLFISATSPNSLPCNMYGLWHGDYNLIWSHNMANENMQMIYWHTFTGGLMEFHKSMFDYFNQRMPEFRESARKMYGCRGIYVVAGTTPNIAYPTQIVPVIMNWTGAAGWIARHYYDYYLFTGDQEFLKNQALPFMYEVALFYEDFLVKEGDNYKCYPSVSPENTPVNFMPTDGKPMAHPMPTTINATMDIAIIKELFTNLIHSADIVGQYKEKVALWQDILNHLPAYAINEDGAVKEWIEPIFEDRYDHRHLSHLYPVFPNSEINEENNQTLYQAFKVAVEKRKLGAQTGWSFMHMAAIYARFGNADKALECMDLLAQSGLLNNFYTLHNDWRNTGVSLNMQEAPIQMDANMGWTNAVQEMLLYNSQTLIKLLPALPKRWSSGKARDWHFMGGTLSFTWSEESFEVIFKINRETKTSVKLPGLFSNYTVNINENAGTLWDQKDLYQLVVKPGDVVTIKSFMKY